jgi:hypothetical protein
MQPKSTERRYRPLLTSEYHSPDFWRQRADDTCAHAGQLKDTDARRTMVQIAKMYAAMAVRTEFWQAQAALAEGKAHPPIDGG